MKEKLISDLEDKAKRIRHHVVAMIEKAGSGHPGGSLSCVDVLTVLYSYKMHHNPKDPGWLERDRFVLCKGHAAPTLYAVLAEGGYFPVEELSKLRIFKSILQGHPDRNRVPGIDVSSGSLGQGLSFANGLALAGRLNKKGYRVYALLGDGECDEGQVWEAAMTAVQYKIDNLTAIVDRNGLQIDGPTESVMSLEPFAEKWRAFGWHVIEIDGHNIQEIISALNESGKIRGQPTVIIAHIIKGKGVSFMEWEAGFHGRAPSREELELAIEELDKK
ncbi:MAG: transketolase [Candidatus Altiarchaeota archaeon]|nr:transketolase [Candidatus Altiarchaeota archaeon]